MLLIVSLQRRSQQNKTTLGKLMHHQGCYLYDVGHKVAVLFQFQSVMTMHEHPLTSLQRSGWQDVWCANSNCHCPHGSVRI
jgi:hypothetical protein